MVFCCICWFEYMFQVLSVEYSLLLSVAAFRRFGYPSWLMLAVGWAHEVTAVLLLCKPIWGVHILHLTMGGALYSHVFRDELCKNNSGYRSSTLRAPITARTRRFISERTYFYWNWTPSAFLASCGTLSLLNAVVVFS